MERWNLGYETLSEGNKGLIMVRLSGYGQTGPKAARPGFGTITESMSTFAHINGFSGSPPLSPPIPIVDLTSAMFAVQGMMFAIYIRDVQGRSGQVVNVSLFEPLFRLMIGDVEAYDAEDIVPTRTGNRGVRAAPRNLYEAEDGHVALSASSQNIFENVYTLSAVRTLSTIHDSRRMTTV